MFNMLWAAALVIATRSVAADVVPASVTFHKDVLPILQKNCLAEELSCRRTVLQKNCQTCHRPGEAGPMSFLTYETTRPWAKAIKEAVRLRKMPPWFADPKIGHFVNDRSLRQSDVDTLAKWADDGAPRGNPKDAPPPVEWPKGWHIRPDVIVEGPAYDVPANPKNNVVEWITVTVPSGFTTDTWITSVEIRPQYPEVTHHMLNARNQGSATAGNWEESVMSKKIYPVRSPLSSEK